MSSSSPSPRRRVLVAGLFHETNTFAEGAMPLADWRVLRGAEILGSIGDGSPIGAFLEYAKKANWELLPAIDVRATPGPMASPEVMQVFDREFSAAAEAARDLDAIFLILHGAMATADSPDVEGRLLEQIARHPRLASAPV